MDVGLEFTTRSSRSKTSNTVPLNNGITCAIEGCERLVMKKGLYLNNLLN